MSDMDPRPHDHDDREAPDSAGVPSYDEQDTRTVPLSTLVTGSSADSPDGRRWTHPLSVGHLVCGLVFLGLAASWALHRAGVIGSDGLPWVLPLVLVVAGAAGLVALLAKNLTNTDSSR